MINPTHNVPEFSVSEISGEIKKTLENNFSYVKIRGEISGLKKAPSGHIYMSLKEDNSVISAVCWRGMAAKLQLQPEDGLEVVAIGKITSYGGQSKYQLIIESLEHAGIGALMALLNKRKEMFIKEGLFEAHHKKKLPYIPSKIGVITSPTGSVIRDIIHRITDRFPTNLIIWPVLVQGDKAALQVKEAIEKFDALPQDHLQKPEILIIARGGGSFEDLWAFNDEDLVRAAFACKIPIISAIGHETDNSLLDLVCDFRAPTPTAAAEIATPVKREIFLAIQEISRRFNMLVLNCEKNARQYFVNLKQNFQRRSSKLDFASQALDELSMRFSHILKNSFSAKLNLFEKKALKLTSQDALIKNCEMALLARKSRINSLLAYYLKAQDQKLSKYSFVTNIGRLKNSLSEKERNLLNFRDKIHKVDFLQQLNQRLKYFSSLLDSYNFNNVIKRGFALIRNEQGDIITNPLSLKAKENFEITLKDGKKTIKISD